MRRSWNVLSQQSGGAYAVEDFERAAYRLVTEQVLYAADRHSRVAYHLVEVYLADFAAALEPLGVRLERNPHHRYICALPNHGDGAPITVDETLLVLVLRQRYDAAMRQGEVEEGGEVLLELPDLQEAYPALVQRPMPDLAVLRGLLRTARRWALCRIDDALPGDTQPFRIAIRPAIVEIVGAHWLQRLDQYRRGDDDDSAAPDVETSGDAAPGDDDVSA